MLSLLFVLISSQLLPIQASQNLTGYNPPWSPVGPYYGGCWPGQCGRQCGNCPNLNEGCSINHQCGTSEEFTGIGCRSLWSTGCQIETQAMNDPEYPNDPPYKLLKKRQKDPGGTCTTYNGCKYGCCLNGKCAANPCACPNDPRAKLYCCNGLFYPQGCTALTNVTTSISSSSSSSISSSIVSSKASSTKSSSTKSSSTKSAPKTTTTRSKTTKTTTTSKTTRTTKTTTKPGNTGYGIGNACSADNQCQLGCCTGKKCMDPCQCPNQYYVNKYCPNGVFTPPKTTTSQKPQPTQGGGDTGATCSVSTTANGGGQCKSGCCYQGKCASCATCFGDVACGGGSGGGGSGGGGGGGGRGRGVFTRCFNPNQVALTFDDGPFTYTRDLLNILDQNGVKATFFINGKNNGDITNDYWAGIVRETAGRGHCIGSHTWDHRSLANVDGGVMDYQMNTLLAQFYKILGKAPRYMRPPYGDLGGYSKEWLLNNGYDIVLWNVDGWDWDLSRSTDYVFSLEDGGINQGNGPIILNHDIVQRTVYDLVQREINVARARGLQFVTMEQCLQASCYR